MIIKVLIVLMIAFLPGGIILVISLLAAKIHRKVRKPSKPPGCG